VVYPGGGFGRNSVRGTRSPTFTFGVSISLNDRVSAMYTRSDFPAVTVTERPWSVVIL
jgi:hypothetical protein